ncbi:MAG TPA: mechanosensitive ion channel domain-containing protein [Chloroflexota bacterium]|nr:mechanosensitive ion channel domain-containing protein [Chloroflexota bacterium]
MRVTHAAMTFNSVWHNLTQEPGLYVWRVAGSLIIVALSLFLGRIAEGRVRRSSHLTTLGPNPSVLLARMVRFTIWLLGLLWILAIFSVPFTALAAVVGVAALALSLSLQDLLKNLIAGIYMLAERPFHIGDVISVQGVTGLIEDIQMRVTYLRTDQGERVVIPNQVVFTQVVVNTTQMGSQAACVQVEAPRSLNADDVSRRVLQAVAGAPDVVNDPSPRLETTSITPEAVTWALHVWLKPTGNVSGVVLALGQAIPEATIGPPPA